ncbi:MAG: Glyoxalase/bleomycin resistance protein/dioxygenase [Rubritepida sp.]|nr:Glyoxalase/bleomycin resistance protein/dioxygenase [Rubritepida sp.]
MQRPSLDQQITFLYAEDPQASWGFYEEVLELPLARDQGSVRIYAVDGSGGFLGVCRASEAGRCSNPRVAGGVVFTFVTQDVEGWHAFLAGKGIALSALEYSATYRITHFFFTDPAGYTLEVQRFEDPA